MNKLILMCSLVTLSFSVQAEDFLYILSARVKLLSAPSFNAQQVESLSKGEKVVSLEKNNRWFRVKYKDKTGWISRLAVSPNPPSKRASRLANVDENFANQSRRRASTVSTTAAVRGLRGEGRSRSSDKNVSDYDSLAKVEQLELNINEIEKFNKALVN